MFIVWIYFTLLIGGKSYVIEANQQCFSIPTEAGHELVCVQLPPRVVI